MSNTRRVKAEELRPGMRVRINAAWQSTRYGTVIEVTEDGDDVEVVTTDPMCKDQAALSVPTDDRRHTMNCFKGQLVSVSETQTED